MGRRCSLGLLGLELRLLRYSATDCVVRREVDRVRVRSHGHVIMTCPDIAQKTSALMDNVFKIRIGLLFLSPRPSQLVKMRIFTWFALGNIFPNFEVFYSLVEICVISPTLKKTQENTKRFLLLSL